MTQDAEKIIDALKRRFHVQSDQGLADVLRVARSTVASWRSRGQVPSRYAQIADDDDKALYSLGIDQWSPAEKAAFVLALIRMHRGYLANVDDYSQFLRKGNMIFAKFTIMLEHAYFDLQDTMETLGGKDPWQSMSLLVFEDFKGDDNDSSGK